MYDLKKRVVIEGALRFQLLSTRFFYRLAREVVHASLSLLLHEVRPGHAAEYMREGVYLAVSLQDAP